MTNLDCRAFVNVYKMRFFVWYFCGLNCCFRCTFFGHFSSYEDAGKLGESVFFTLLFGLYCLLGRYGALGVKGLAV